MNKIITIPEPSNAYVQMAFLQTKPTTETTKMVTTLIFSMQCPHCFEIISFLESKHNSMSTLNWRFAITDSDTDSLQKATEFINKFELSSNPFSLLKAVKKTDYDFTQFEINKNLRSHSKKALSFLSNNGVNIIPTLVVEKSQGQKNILVGIGEITNFINNLNN